MKRRTLILVTAPALVAFAIGLTILRRPGGREPQLAPVPPIVVTDTTAYTSRPLNRGELSKPILSIDFPPDATDIQFAEYACWQACIVLVRFHASTETCTAYASALLADFNRNNPTRPLPLDLHPIERPPEKSICDELPTPWFTPETIRNGLKGGQQGSHQPQIWIDSDRGIFYYQYED